MDKLTEFLRKYYGNNADPQIIRQMILPDHFTRRITELVGRLDLDLEEFLPVF